MAGPYGRAFQVAGMAYRNRKRIYRAASTIGRAYKRYKGRRGVNTARKRQRIGERVGQGTTKRTTTRDNQQFYSTRTLYNQNMLRINKNSTGGEQIDKRERNIVNFRGFKYCLEMANQGLKPMHVNVAVVVPKNKNLVANNDFFRGSETDRAMSFNNDRSSNDFRCRPLNPDVMTILMHKTFTFGPITHPSLPGFEGGTSASYRTMDGYCKIGRQLRFDTGNPLPVTECNLIWWCDGFGTPGGTAPIENQLNMSMRCISYFKDSK